MITSVSGAKIGMNDQRPMTAAQKERIFKWERLTRQNWDESRELFFVLAAKYDISIAESNPDDPRFSILKRADLGQMLFPEDFKIMEILGEKHFETKLTDIRETLGSWERETGKESTQSISRFMTLAARYDTKITDWMPSNPLMQALEDFDSGLELSPEHKHLLESATGDRNLVRRMSIRLRIKNWEDRTGEGWETCQSEYISLTRWYDVQVDRHDPNDDLFAVLRQLRSGLPLDPSQRQVLIDHGGPSLAVRLIYQRSVDEWESRNGLSWSEEFSAFERLRRKYSIPEQNVHPDDPLIEILKRLDSGIELEASELERISASGAPELASRLDEIRITEIEYRETLQPAKLAKICRLWRESNRPDRALEATSRVIDSSNQSLIDMDPDIEGMLLATRGGALRDLHCLYSARNCAERSIQIRPRRGHAYCLLGAIELEEGTNSRAEECFSICEELEPGQADNWRRGAIERAKFPSEYAAYLIDKDAQRFSWARKHLR